MQRFTISLDEDLARQFDELIAHKGYVNRSEAVRDLIRHGLGKAALDDHARKAAATWCVASLSYVYDHHDQTVTARLLDVQHEHHDLVVSSLHTHLDHDHCLETVVLRGKVVPVRACAEQIIALRGVRHGQLHLVPLEAVAASQHSHNRRQGKAHGHLKPVN
ncbi:nickel-responsive transcriptional regulator NikR [Variovorax robiniae]|uniref:Putative nickel-responsive regulator n=1 Tax=Variovorax robiniae TaxID=1836199 RepID=A0ABU8XJH9_9BURK